MTDSVNIRALALDTILEITENGGYSHKVIGAVLDKYRYLPKHERAFFTRLSEGTVQRMIEMDYIIDLYSKVKTVKMKPVIRGILRMSVYQLIYMDSVPASAACNEAVKLAAKRGFSQLTGFVNGVLRNISRNTDAISYPDMAIKYSMPQWIADRWISDYGEEQTEKILSSFLCDAPITIRTNLAKTTTGELCSVLENEGVRVMRIPDIPYAFAISGFDSLAALDSFRDGLFYVQDISSMMVAEWAAPSVGDYCIDVCAAPGGKSLHLAQKMKSLADAATVAGSKINAGMAETVTIGMTDAATSAGSKINAGNAGKAGVVQYAGMPDENDPGVVDARDVSDEKVALILENIERQGITNVNVKKWDATVDDTSVHDKADVLIADLPCSGLGTLRKKSDIKYRITEKSIASLVALQRQILGTVCAYVKPGGVMIYSTCTIDKAENEENVEWFLREHPDFELADMRQIFPGEELGDGFFLSKLRRNGS